LRNKKKRIIIAYACEDAGSEPGVGYYWTKSFAKIYPNEEITLITRKNNNVSELEKDYNITKIGVDLNKPLLRIKKWFGVRVYYQIWLLLVFFHLLINYNKYRGSIVHHITFTPVYYPPIYFLLPFNFIWGPVGGGETYPLSYLKNMTIKDKLKELFGIFLKYSIYVNPLFYIGCINSSKIICSTSDTAKMIPKVFKNKVVIELMVFDQDKRKEEVKIKKDIVIANRLINWKMTQLFVKAFSEYSKFYDNEYRLIIIGNGPYYNEIQEYIDDKKIIYIKRFDKREDMLAVLKSASLFVSMSLRDSGAASLLEAVSYGVPFLVTDSGAHKVFLEKDIGFSFSLESFDKDKDKIIVLLKSILENDEILKEEKNKIYNVYNSYFNEFSKINRIKELLRTKENEE
jgi:glycosyltransferase involved in cell wall biosynthesis